MNSKKLQLGDWKICCNDMVDALLDDRIQATDQNVEDQDLFIDEGSNLNFCPWCGVKIPRLKQKVI